MTTSGSRLGQQDWVTAWSVLLLELHPLGKREPLRAAREGEGMIIAVSEKVPWCKEMCTLQRQDPCRDRIPEAVRLLRRRGHKSSTDNKGMT